MYRGFKPWNSFRVVPPPSHQQHMLKSTARNAAMQERVHSDPAVLGGHMFRSASTGSGHSLGSASCGVSKLGRSSQRRRTGARMDTYAQVGKQLLQL